eukprot:14124653-Heterocapsa_arctica.AAC.1
MNVFPWRQVIGSHLESVVQKHCVRHQPREGQAVGPQLRALTFFNVSSKGADESTQRLGPSLRTAERGGTLVRRFLDDG